MATAAAAPTGPQPNLNPSIPGEGQRTGNIYYPDPLAPKIILGEPGNSGLSNFRNALLRPGWQTMRGTTAQRVQRGIEDMAEFAKVKVRELLESSLSEDEVEKIADRLSTRGQISAFALAFNLQGLSGIDVGTCDMPLDVGDILGLLYTAGLYGHRAQIETGLGSLIATAVEETAWDVAHVQGLVATNRMRIDVPPRISKLYQPLVEFLHHRGLLIWWKRPNKRRNRWRVKLHVESIGLGYRRWEVRAFSNSPDHTLQKAARSMLLRLQAAYADPTVF